MDSYTDLLRAEAKKDSFNFLDFINQLNNEQLYRFIEDIVTENTDAIRPAFPPFKGVYTDDLAFQAMREMPYATYQKIKGYLEDIFTNALNGNYSNNQKVIDNIIALTARRRQGLSFLYIEDILKKIEVAEDIKVNLAILLSKLENTVPLSFWDTAIDYEKQPYLIPAFVSAYKTAAPVKALEKLITINKPEDFIYYKRSIITSLENILVRNRDFQSYISLYDRAQPWLKSEFDQVLNSTAFAKHRIGEEIAALRENKQEIKIGISLFPDLLLLQLAYNLGSFSRDRNHSYNIKIVDWNNIFNLLIDEELDFIIANRDVCEEANGPTESFKFIYPLIEYKGFSIIFQKDFPITPYKEVHGIVGNRQEAIKDTLMQLVSTEDRPEKIKIFASKNTDHYNTLLDTLDLVGLKDSDVNIISDLEPHDGYTLFANKEVDAIVGGLPQKLLALRNGGKELISQNDCDLPFTQVNGLICRTSRVKELEKSADKIMYQWTNIVKDVIKKPEYLYNLAKIYNETVRIQPSPYNPLDEELFLAFWDKTFFIPATKQDAEKLINSNDIKKSQIALKKAIAALQS